jgi:hypothetical protein
VPLDIIRSWVGETSSGSDSKLPDESRRWCVLIRRQRKIMTVMTNSEKDSDAWVKCEKLNTVREFYVPI